MLIRTAGRRLLGGRHVPVMRAGISGMVIVARSGVLLMLHNRRRFCDHARANAVPCAEQDRQRGKEGRL